MRTARHARCGAGPSPRTGYAPRTRAPRRARNAPPPRSSSSSGSEDKKAEAKVQTKVKEDQGYLELDAAAATATTEAFVRQSLRSQLTGGVQATTATLDLPEPHVAVRNLVEYAKHAHMSTVMSSAQHRRAGYPFGSIVEFAVEAEGAPVFAMSSLAIHTRNVLANPRCAIQIHAPGWTGLNNARVTLFGDVYPVSPESYADANGLFVSKRKRMSPFPGPGAKSEVNGANSANPGTHTSSKIPLANTRYFVMGKIVDILFVGGYGTVTWIKPEEYKKSEPDFILQDLSLVVKTCNERFSSSIKKVVPEADDVVFISVDKRGVELRVREGTEDSVRRLMFKKHCFTIEDVVNQLNEIIKVD